MNYLTLIAGAIFILSASAVTAQSCQRCKSDAGVIYDRYDCGFHQIMGQGDEASCKAQHARENQDSFSLCAAASINHNVFIGGRNNDLLVLTEKGVTDWRKGKHLRIQDGKDYSCGGDVQSGNNFTALRYGRHRDIIDIFIRKSARNFDRHTDRIHDGRGQVMVAGGNYVARLYGNHHDIVKLYGIRSDGAIVSKAQLIADGRGHILQRLSSTDVGVTYGRNKDIRVRFCFDGSRWNTGYIGIGHGFKATCDKVLNW